VIRAARQAAGLSQTELASRIGVAQGAVGQWERGQVIPTLPMYCGLIGVLGAWPLLEALLPPDQTAAAIRAPLHRTSQSSGIAASLRAARRAAGLSQPQLGLRVGVRQSTVSQWERGRVIPTLPMVCRLVAVLGPWPLLEALLPSQRADPHDTPPGPRPSRGERPSRTELARLIVQERLSDQQLADHYGQPIGVILRWRRAHLLARAAPPSRMLGRPPRPSRQELERLAIQEGRSDAELAVRYDRSVITIQTWRRHYRLVRRPRRVDLARLLVLCRQGLPARQIAQELGCTPSTVYRIARTAGVPVASNGSPSARRPRPAGRVEAERGLAVVELTAAQVAGLFQVSEPAVHKWADRGRLPSRKIKGQRRFPVPAIAQLARQHQVPLPNWLASAVASTSREAS
jgi:transcriptional regulator with XRE-family HTH domain